MVLTGGMADGTDFLTEGAQPASPIQEYRTGLASRIPGRWSARPAWHGDLVPLAPVGPYTVALGLARAGVRGRGVQRMPVVGGLERPAGPHDRADSAGHRGTPGRRPGHRRPAPGTAALAGRLPCAVRAEPVQRVALVVGQYGDVTDVPGLQHGRFGLWPGRRWARKVQRPPRAGRDHEHEGGGHEQP